MPERRARRRPLAAAAVGLLLAVLAAPAALAQSQEIPEGTTPPDRWAASAFDAPFDQTGHVVRAQPFDASGTLRYEKRGPAEHIVRAEVRVVPDRRHDLRDGCRLPDPVEVPGPGPTPDLVAELRFAVGGIEVVCNGRYVLEVEGTLDDPDAPTHVLRQPFTVGSLPPAVTDLDVGLDERTRTATVTFTPVPDEDLDPDALGYVLERGGPAEGVSAGSFVDVGALDLDDQPRFVDDLGRAAAGTYTYRVRALRAGADGPERSSIIDTETATVTIGEPPDGPPPTDAAAIGRSPRRSGVSITRRGPATSRRVTVTTLDTGFEGTIDYGELPEGTTRPTTGDTLGDEPLAGQSIITDEGEGVDLAAPVAGALVLLGWAGHIAYLNRLAKQLAPVP